MPIHFEINTAVFTEVVSVEDAEGLLEWLQNKPTATVDLSACAHLHSANLQVLMAAKTPVSVWQKDASLRAWLETALIST